MKQNTYQGSFTIEAALVIPILLFVIFGLLSVSYYLHDLCVLQSLAEDMACSISHSNGEDTDTEKDITTYVDKRLFLATLKEPEVSLSGNQITVSIVADVSFPFPILHELLGQSDIKVIAKSKMYDPTTLVRYQKLLLDELQRTKLYDHLGDLLEKVKKAMS